MYYLLVSHLHFHRWRLHLNKRLLNRNKGKTEEETTPSAEGKVEQVAAQKRRFSLFGKGRKSKKDASRDIAEAPVEDVKDVPEEVEEVPIPSKPEDEPVKEEAEPEPATLPVKEEEAKDATEEQTEAPEEREAPEEEEQKGEDAPADETAEETEEAPAVTAAVTEEMVEEAKTKALGSSIKSTGLLCGCL